MFQIFKKSNTLKPIIVTFTGGMGAQMISAAIYFKLKQENTPVFADLSYFEKPLSRATVGAAGAVSHWDWQLDYFNIKIESFVKNNSYVKRQMTVIDDGANKFNLGITYLKEKSIQSLFPIINFSMRDHLHIDSKNYMCIHIRRGDYVNVASHLISDEYFYNAAKKFVNLTKKLIVVSDSVINEDLKIMMSKLFPTTIFLDATNEFEAHCVMRCADILLCSNSQFSLIAALLNQSGLVLIPKIWFGDAQKEFEPILSNLGKFQLMT